MKKVPLRQCLGCREMKPKNELIRVVRSPAGDVTMDPAGKKPGRGAYLCNDMNCYKRVVKTNALSRAFKTQIPDDVTKELQSKMEGGESTNGS